MMYGDDAKPEALKHHDYCTYCGYSDDYDRTSQNKGSCTHRRTTTYGPNVHSSSAASASVFIVADQAEPAVSKS